MPVESNADLQGLEAKGIKSWIDLSDKLPHGFGFMHSGVVQMPNGKIACAHPEGRSLLIVDPYGPTKIIETELIELHGIAMGFNDDQLAVADPGYRMDRMADGHYEELLVPGRAALISARTGNIEVEFLQPELAAYAQKTWHPTSITVGMSLGQQQVWVADGYGENLIHVFDAKGNYLSSINSFSRDDLLDCPHAIVFKPTSPDDGEIFVADRGNHRILVFDSVGVGLRKFGEQNLDSPSGLGWVGDDLYVTELSGGLTKFTGEKFVTRIENQRERSRSEPGWPNESASEDRFLTPPKLKANTFNSPHGAHGLGNQLVLTEWVIGGRLILLEIDT